MSQDRRVFFVILTITIIFSSFFGAMAGWFVNGANAKNAVIAKDQAGKVQIIDEESAVVSVVEKSMPAVVSIVVSKDLPKYEYSSPATDPFFQQFFGDNSEFQQFFGVPQQRKQIGSEKQEIGGGTGFLISKDGYIVTNKHVIFDDQAEYTVVMNDDKKYTAKILAKDPINDLAVIKIEGKNFPSLTFGDSSKLKAGQTVVAIGNALGEFRNTVSKGVISGLSRSITAGGGMNSERLIGLIQTDASINPGNSGGPLLNISGQVIGINVAMAQGAQSIGFAIPVNQVKKSVDSVKKTGKIVRTWLGVRHIILNKAIADQNKLPKDYGAMLVRGNQPGEVAVVPGSPADKAGLMENDIILEINGKKITEKNPLPNMISEYQPGQTIGLKVFRKGEEINLKVKLEEAK